MKAGIYYSPKDVRVEERPMPEIGPNDVLVKNIRAGICGTDLTAYLYSGDAVSIFANNEFGHEMVGVVEKIGINVKDIKPGLRVFVNPVTCKREGMVRCDSAGAFSQYIVVEEAKIGYNLFLIADDVSFDEAVVTEPFSVAVSGKNIPKVKKGDHVVVYGSGTIGLCTLCALVGMGINDAVVIDINDERLEVVKNLGGVPLNSQKINTKDFLTKHFGGTLSHIGLPVPDVDVVIDCAGAPPIMNEYLDMAKPGSRMCVVAVYKAPVSVNLTGIMSAEATILGSCGYSISDIEEVLYYINGHKTKVGQIVTHHFPIEKLAEAFAFASDPANKSIKVVIDHQ